MARKILFGIVLALLVVAFYAYAGEVKLTTYYPAPYGEYKRIATKTLGVGNNDGSADGAITSSDAPDPATSSGDVWIAGKLGIGTTAPAGALDVRGGSAAAATNGTSLNFYAQRGGSGNTNGGNIILMPGLGAGTGTEGNVGIGTPTPAYPLDIFKIYHTLGSYQSPLNIRGLYTAAGAGDNNGIRIIAEAGHTSGSIVNLAGASILARNLNEGSVNYLRGLVVGADNNSTSGGTVSESIGVLIQANTGPGAITNNYGIYQAGTTAKNYFGGKVGIGTTSPSNILEVRRDAAAATNGITLNNQQGNGWGSALTFRSNYTSAYDAAQIIGGGTSSQGNGSLLFRVGIGGTMTQAMYIANSGKVRIGATGAAQAPLDVAGDASDQGGIFHGSIDFGKDGVTKGIIRTKAGSDLSPGGNQGNEVIITLQNNGSAGSQDEIWLGPNTGTAMGYIHLSATTIKGNGPYQNISDANLKTGIVTIPNALERVCALRGVNFYWKDKNYPQSLQMGVVGQEVEKVFPDVVTSDGEGKKYVTYESLIGPLIEAVKELKKENTELKTRITTLENINKK